MEQETRRKKKGGGMQRSPAEDAFIACPQRKLSSGYRGNHADNVERFGDGMEAGR